MEKLNPDELIIKYLNQDISEEEMQYLSEWLGKKGNARIFRKYVRLHHAAEHELRPSNTERVKRNVMQRIQEQPKGRVRTLNRFIYAAAAVVAFAVLAASAVFYFRDAGISSGEMPVTEVSIEPGAVRAVLELEDGKEVLLEKGKTFSQSAITSSGEDIVYTADSEDEEKAEEITFNTLTIPRGGEYKVVLADGSKIWLNSETKIKYPTKFIDGEDRIVTLIYGEAYFDVSPGSEHGGSAFHVFSQDHQVRVLGTEFNVKTNLGSKEVFTTLVEGSVAVRGGDAEQKLVPGEQSVFHMDKGGVDVMKVDVDNVVAWKNGFFSFENQPLQDILEELSRWYDFSYEFENQDLREHHFTGYLSRNDNLSDLLILMEKTKLVEFEQDGQRLIIK